MNRVRYRFPKDRRILTSLDFGQVMKRGAFAADDNLVINARITEVQSIDGRFVGRLGVTIPKKTGNAVVRNHWKRLIREAYRLEQHNLPAGFDLVIKPRRGAIPEFHSIRKSLRRLVGRATKTKSSGSKP